MRWVILGLLAFDCAANAQGIIPIEQFSGYGVVFICGNVETCRKDHGSYGMSQMKFIDKSSQIAKLLSLSLNNNGITAAEVYHSYVVSDLSKYSPNQIKMHIQRKNSANLPPINLPKLNFMQTLLRPLNISGMVGLYKEECPACVDMKPFLKDLCRKNWLTLWDIGAKSTDLKCKRINAGKVYKTYSLMYSPTFLYLRDGKVIWTWSGYRDNLEEISQLLRSFRLASSVDGR